MSNPRRDWALNFEKKNMVSSLGVHVAALSICMTLAMGAAVRLSLKSLAFCLSSPTQVTSKVLVYNELI